MSDKSSVISPAFSRFLLICGTAGGFPAGFFAGNLLVAAGDEDHFLIEAAPNAGDFLYVTCSAQRAGSGLRQFKATAYNADTGMAIAGATATETDTAQLSFGDQGVALGGATSVIVKVEAGMQDPVVLGNYYQCGVVFLPPM
jgi:hypothetical protein